MTIVDLNAGDADRIEQVAILLMEAFVRVPDFAKTIDEARKEVKESFAPGRISRIAVDDNGTVLGWVGGIPEYDGNRIRL
jgi:aminoglycoside 6'-N-acetyltransferase I